MHASPDATASTGHVMGGLAGGSAAAATPARSSDRGAYSDPDQCLSHRRSPLARVSPSSLEGEACPRVSVPAAHHARLGAGQLESRAGTSGANSDAADSVDVPTPIPRPDCADMLPPHERCTREAVCSASAELSKIALREGRGVTAGVGGGLEPGPRRQGVDRRRGDVLAPAPWPRGLSRQTERGLSDGGGAERFADRETSDTGCCAWHATGAGPYVHRPEIVASRRCRSC